MYLKVANYQLKNFKILHKNYKTNEKQDPDNMESPEKEIAIKEQSKHVIFAKEE